MNVVAFHPKLVTFGIGLGITFVIGIAIGMTDHEDFGTNSGNNGPLIIK